jgi:hypothetical protein
VYHVPIMCFDRSPGGFSLYLLFFFSFFFFFFFFFWERQVTADFTIPATVSRPSKDRQERRATWQTPSVRMGTTLAPHGYTGGTLQCTPAQSTGPQGPAVHLFCFYSTSLPHSSHNAGACTQEACQRKSLTLHHTLNNAIPSHKTRASAKA